MKNLNRRQIRKVLMEELVGSGEKGSEKNQFAKSKSGNKVIKTAETIKKAGATMYEVAQDQTGAMRETLGNVSKFVYEMGCALSEMNNLEEGESVSNRLPSVQEYKNLLKQMERLEKM